MQPEKSQAIEPASPTISWGWVILSRIGWQIVGMSPTKHLNVVKVESISGKVLLSVPAKKIRPNPCTFPTTMRTLPMLMYHLLVSPIVSNMCRFIDGVDIAMYATQFNACIAVNNFLLGSGSFLSSVKQTVVIMSMTVPTDAAKPSASACIALCKPSSDLARISTCESGGAEAKHQVSAKGALFQSRMVSAWSMRSVIGLPFGKGARPKASLPSIVAGMAAIKHRRSRTLSVSPVSIL
mmetsp:Transcript_20007/g.59899  ORF Transcript_20007/g.59899 Transcript_20007/m.59899 type:complete len:238 (+) Transcript_20007:266-979(+)